MLTSVLASVVLAQVFDGKAAIAKGKSLIINTSHAKAVSLTGLRTATNENWHFQEKAKWAVGLSDDRKRSYSLIFSPAGKLLYLSARDPIQLKTTGGAPAKQVVKPWIERALKSIDHVPNLQMGDVGIGETQIAGDMHLLVNGKRIFNINPTYGYHLCFDPKGDLIWFGRSDHPPRPNATSARTEPGVAKRLLTAYAKSAEKQDGIARLFAPDWPNREQLRVELGYYAFKGESTMRLVYRGVAWFTAGGKAHDDGPLRMYVDALTGKTIAPDDPSMK